MQGGDVDEGERKHPTNSSVLPLLYATAYLVYFGAGMASADVFCGVERVSRTGQTTWGVIPITDRRRCPDVRAGPRKEESRWIVRVTSVQKCVVLSHVYGHCSPGGGLGCVSGDPHIQV